MTDTQSGQWGGYNQSLGYVTQLGAGILEILDAKAGEVILDAGGGTGVQAKQMLDKGADVTLIDSAAEQVAEAQKLVGTRAIQGSIEDMPQEWTGKFDAVYSSAVFHYLRNPEKAFSELARVLKDGGRLVFEMGGSFTQNFLPSGSSNLQILQTSIRTAAAFLDLPSPLVRTHAQFANLEGIQYIYHPTADSITQSLAEAGMAVGMVRLFKRPTPIEVGALSKALKGYTSNYTAGLRPEQLGAFLSEATEIASRDLPRDGNGKLIMDYVRLQVVATKGAR